MRRVSLALAFATLFFALAGVAAAEKTGAPEVDQTDATFTLTGPAPTVTAPCAGEDDVTYQTITNTYTGRSTDSSPGQTDFRLDGTLSVRITLTFGFTTFTGIARGAATLKRRDAIVMKGSFTAITQITNPDTMVGNARGWIDGEFYEDGAPTNTDLLATVEFSFDLAAQQISGHIGGPANTGALLYAVQYNRRAC